MSCRARFGLGVALTAAAAIAAPAVSAQAPSAAAAPAVAGWDGFAEAVRGLPALMLAKLPVAMQHDPQVQQEVGRLALAAIASSAIDTLGSDGDHPAFVATINQVLNVGQPNADTIYRVARITPGGSYRLRGMRGSLPIVRIAEGGPSPYEPGWKPETGVRPYHDVNALHVDRDGRYDVLLSPARPAGYAGDWWPLQPGTTKLLLRAVSADWGNQRDPTFSIERVDLPPTRARVTAATLEARLRQLPGALRFIAPLFVDHVEKLRGEGFVNRLKVLDASRIGGLGGQVYYEGAYDLADDEALIVEATVPAGCTYRSLILTNEIYETTDWYNNHSSLNGAQAGADRDGVLRIVVSGRDPGVPNWLDTAGYRRGLLQGRWTDCAGQPTPSVRKLALRDVRAALPPETRTIDAAERRRIVRERRAAYQQRPLW